MRVFVCFPPIFDLPPRLPLTGRNLSSLRLETTKSVVAENIRVPPKILRDMRRMTVRLHTDDFGKGYSSLGGPARSRSGA